VKIDEFGITRYGPLPESGRILLHDFNLFFGANEDGKTLTIDALVKLMFGQNIKDFERINRVEENPVGYVILRDDRNKQIKIPEKGTFTKITGLTPSECRNVFIIRNSDLSISRPEGEFFTNLADRLVGLRTEELSRIGECLREIGQITPSGALRDSKDQKLKSRMEKARRLIEEIEELNVEIEIKGLDRLEEQVFGCKEEMEKIKQKVDLLEDARKREMYEKGKKSLDKLEDDLANLGKLENYDQEDADTWRDCERDNKNASEEKGVLLRELKGNEDDFAQKEQALEEKRRDFRILQDVKKELDEEVRPELKNYGIRSVELSSQAKKNNFFTSGGVISSALLLVSLIGLIFSSSALFYVLAAVSSLLSVALWMLKYQYVRNKSKLSALFEKARLITSKHALSAESIGEMLSKIQKFDEEFIAKSDELQAMVRKNGNLQNKITELRSERIPRLEKKIESANEKINIIKKDSGEEALSGYVRCLHQKEALEKSVDEQGKVLESLFEKKSKKTEENIAFWESEISDLEEYSDKAKGIKYDEKSIPALKRKQKELETTQKELASQLSAFQQSLQEIGRKANEVLRLEEYIYCKAHIDLEAVWKALEQFEGQNEMKKENVLQAISIFDEIENEEKSKVSDLFGENSLVSSYFREITCGLYDVVYFEADTGYVNVKRKDGVVIEAGKLSGGAYDQLYLSIRLALGDRMLKGGKAFFIMDDPFIKSDKKRLQAQMNILKRISQLGWQIMYFTAKDEVKETIKEDLDSDRINYIETHSIET
jgi:uncharacterized protein YhaN